MSDLMEYIKVQWDDIHHSRKQEWQFLLPLVGIFAGLFTTTVSEHLQVPLSLLGLVVCSLGLYTSVAHWTIFYSKRQLIRQCERSLGINARVKRSPFPVQGIIVMLYVLLGSCLLCWLLVSATGYTIFPHILAVVVFCCGSAVTYKLARWFRRILDLNDEGVLTLDTRRFMDCRKPARPDLPDIPLYAEQRDIEDCLTLLGKRPLKIVANELHRDETPWNGGKWLFTQEQAEVVDKKLLVNACDIFQFSVANESSRQEYHTHKGVVEIFVGQSQMRVYYGPAGRERSMEVSRGVLIVPPHLRHKVELWGCTFVFQCAVHGVIINNDKELA
jgi:hypothetical protein